MTQITIPTQLQNRLDAFLGISIQIFAIVFLARFTLDIGTRMMYPFIPQISAGLGLTVVGFSWLLFIRAIVGITGPVFGILADRYGCRKIMALGLMLQAIGTVSLTISWEWWTILPIIPFGLGLAAFIPAQQAYISDLVSYHRRGRALAAVEFSWATVGIIILPIIGWIIDAFGWRIPFAILGLLSLISIALVWIRLPSAEHTTHTVLSWAQVKTVFYRSNVLAAITVSWLNFIAVGSFMAVWSIWLTADFGLEAVTLGLIATSIGVAELSGSGLSSLFIDRFGKKRGSGLGLFLGAVAFLLLPLTQNWLVLAILTLSGMGLVIEFAIVSLIPLYSEQVPQARGTVLSLALLGSGIGAAMGAPITAILWENYGLWAVCITAAGCLLAACGVLLKLLKEVSTTNN